MGKYFRPQRDITAYEVAFILAKITPTPGGSIWSHEVMFTPDQWAKELTDETRRHFSDTP